MDLVSSQVLFNDMTQWLSHEIVKTHSGRLQIPLPECETWVQLMWIAFLKGGRKLCNLLAQPKGGIWMTVSCTLCLQGAEAMERGAAVPTDRAKKRTTQTYWLILFRFLPADTFPSHPFSSFPTIPGLIPLIFPQIMLFLRFISGLHLLRFTERWGYECQLRSALGSVEEFLGSIKCQWHIGDSRVMLAQQMEALLSWRGVMFLTNTQAHTHSSVHTGTHIV